MPSARALGLLCKRPLQIGHGNCWFRICSKEISRLRIRWSWMYPSSTAASQQQVRCSNPIHRFDVPLLRHRQGVSLLKLQRRIPASRTTTRAVETSKQRTGACVFLRVSLIKTITCFSPTRMLTGDQVTKVLAGSCSCPSLTGDPKMRNEENRALQVQVTGLAFFTRSFPDPTGPTSQELTSFDWGWSYKTNT